MRQENYFNEVDLSQEDSLLIDRGPSLEILTLPQDNPGLTTIDLVEIGNVINHDQI